MPIEQSTHFINYLLPIRKFFKLLKPSAKDVYLMYGYAIFSGIIALSLPLGIQSIIGFIMGAQMSFSLFLLISLVLLGLLFSGFLQIMQMWISESIQERIFVRTAFEFAHKIPRFKNEALNNVYLPELVNRFFDSTNIQKGLNKILIDFTSAIFQVLFGLLLLSFYHPFFVFFGLFLIFLLFILLRFTLPRGIASSLRESKMKYKVVFWLEEVARNQKIFKLNNHKDFSLHKTDKLVSHWLKERKGHFKILIQQYWFLVGFKLLVTSGLLIIGTNLIFAEQINIGQFVASEIIIILVISSVEKLIMSLEAIYDVATSAEKLDQVLSIPTDEQGVYKLESKDNKIEIEINNLSVNSMIYDAKILKNINLTIKPGEKVCLVGKGGSGKSTLSNLLSGINQNYEGNILFNKISLKNINLDDLYTYISGDFGNQSIFNGSLYENLTLGRNDIDMSHIIKAIEDTNLTEFIGNLPNGLNTVLYPNDELLSNSIVKKIEIARNLILKPAILVVEDFIGTMGREDESRICNLLTSKEAEWTLIIVSNSSLLASMCDRIIYLEKGEIKINDHFENLKNRKEITETLN
jgi:ABC-type bacteriocin/lantibiotic exporter with double-glycine peptidase domain